MTSWRKCCCTDERYHLDKKRPVHSSGCGIDVRFSPCDRTHLPVLWTNECSGRRSSHSFAHCSDGWEHLKCTELLHRHQSAAAPHSDGHHRRRRSVLRRQYLSILILQSACHTGYFGCNQRHLCGCNSCYYPVLQYSGNAAHRLGLWPDFRLFYSESRRQE